MYGDILHVINDLAIRHGFDRSVDQKMLCQLFRAGLLSPLLPDGHCWLSRVNIDGLALSIESEPTSMFQPLGITKDGCLVIQGPLPDQGFQTRIKYPLPQGFGK